MQVLMLQYPHCSFRNILSRDGISSFPSITLTGSNTTSSATGLVTSPVMDRGSSLNRCWLKKN
ncbi:hypothetical protein T07_14916 [Trichinella nelsoni]|uniref:Uncharacterized protein n=1 Tax=Trichinella nelsoni TaxID=6336 RepID=A0A0V0RF28_9BILA|nr:hypothetical protein T07_14916 [Trichinella nelsoni]